jgi:diguanylate cyclase (GGDEF)-like protein
MKILVIEREAPIHDQLRELLSGMGHEVFVEPIKNCLPNRLAATNFDCVLIDPSPLETPRPAVLSIRRMIPRFVYMAVLSPRMSQSDAIRAGTNDCISLPINESQLTIKINNAQRLVEIVKHLGDVREDFPSIGGIISKSAFNQLFLSGIDRADRYGEKNFVLFISLDNFRELLNLDGAYAADFAVAKMAKFIGNIRRQSDIIGQTGRAEFAILLRAAAEENESLDAANRFAESFTRDGLTEILSDGTRAAQISLRLIALPTGHQNFESRLEKTT